MWRRTADYHCCHSTDGTQSRWRIVSSFATPAIRSTDCTWSPALPNLRSDQRAARKRRAIKSISPEVLTRSADAMSQKGNGLSVASQVDLTHAVVETRNEA